MWQLAISETEKTLGTWTGDRKSICVDVFECNVEVSQQPAASSKRGEQNVRRSGIVLLASRRRARKTFARPSPRSSKSADAGEATRFDTTAGINAAKNMQTYSVRQRDDPKDHGPKVLDLLQNMEFPQLDHEPCTDDIISKCWHNKYVTIAELDSHTEMLFTGGAGSKVMSATSRADGEIANTEVANSRKSNGQSSGAVDKEQTMAKGSSAKTWRGVGFFNYVLPASKVMWTDRPAGFSQYVSVDEATDLGYI
jgi:hypothetical protein